MKITNKLSLIFTVLMLVIGLGGYFLTIQIQKIIKENITGDTLAIAKQTMSEIDMNIYHRINLVQGYALSLSRQPYITESNKKFGEIRNKKQYIADKEREWSAPEDKSFIRKISNNELSREIREEFEIKDFYRKKYGYELFSEVFLTNRYGVNIAQSEKTTDYYQADEEWWRKAKEKGLYVSNIAYDKSAGVYAVDICVRIVGPEGDFLGVLKTVLNIKDVISVINNVKRNSPYETTVIKLVNRNNELIYNTRPGFKIFQQVPETALLSKQNIKNKKDYSIYRKLNGTKELIVHYHSIGYRYYKGLGWKLFLEFKTSEIFAPAHALKKYIYTFFGFILVFTIITMLTIYKTLSAPIIKLKNAALDIGKGNFNIIIDINSNDEIGELADTFKSMSFELKTSIEKDKKLVAETAKVETERKNAEELQAANEEYQAANEELQATNEELQRAYEELKKSAEKNKELRKLIDMANDAVYIISPETGRIIDVNKKACDSLGYTADELLSLNVFDFDQLITNIQAWIRFASSLRVSGHTLLESEHIRKNGKKFPVEINGRYVFGNVNKIVAFARDISERKKTEKKLLKNQRLKAIGEVSAGIAHDFNNSLQRILTGTETLLAQDNISEHNKYTLTRIKESVKLSAENISRLLRFSENKSLNAEGEVISINSIISAVLKQIAPLKKMLAEKNNADFTINCEAAKDYFTAGRKSELIEAFYNILKNSFEAMPDGGIIEITTLQKKQNIYITISDSGIGMDEETAAELFEPFFTKKEIGTGTGIGLSGAYAAIKDAGGNIRVKKTASGKGTTVEVVLPLAEIVYSKLSSGYPPEKQNPETEKQNSIKVLWVDDQKDIREMGATLLKMAGYKAVTASSGTETLKKLGRHTFEVVITDIGMPDMNGWELAAKIKKLYPAVKLIALSGWNFEVTDKQIKEKGFIEILRKPVSYVKLNEILNKVIKL